MNAHDYLTRLQSQLNGFSPEEKTELIEEIAAHIEAGEKDPGLGHDAVDRARRLEKELGSPDELGRGLRQVHRPGRWLNYCLVVLPTVLIFPLLPLIATWMSGLPAQVESLTWISLRLMICLQAGLVLISRWKASAGVLIHWLASILLAITGLLLSEIRWPWLPANAAAKNTVPLLEMGFWFTALTLLLIWMVRVVRRQHSEPLLVILAVTPFLFAAANYAAGLTLLYFQVDQVNYVFPRIGWFGLSQVASFIWPALFFLPNQRDLRWAGLMLLPITYLVYNFWPYHSYPLVVTLYLLPACLVLVTWTRDIYIRLIPATH
jgi:hypothetical protein